MVLYRDLTRLCGAKLDKDATEAVISALSVRPGLPDLREKNDWIGGDAHKVAEDARD
jgi:hypothetical protein